MTKRFHVAVALSGALVATVGLVTAGCQGGSTGGGFYYTQAASVSSTSAPHDDPAGVACTSCHTSGDFTRAIGDASCKTCHQATGAHGGHSCLACHDPHVQHQKALDPTSLGRFLLTTINGRSVRFVGKTGPGSFADGDATHDGVCEVCHSQTSFYRIDGTAPLAHGTDGLDCTTCHTHQAGFAPPFRLSDPHRSLSCTACHQSGASFTRYDSITSASCTDSCHRPDGTGTATAADVHGSSVVGSKYGTWGAECKDCHNPHQQEQLIANASPHSKLVKTQIVTPAGNKATVRLVADRGPGGLADGDGTYDGACEVCHTRTEFHRGDASGNHVHFEGQRCTNCHKHAKGFQPDSASCMVCHSVARDDGDGLPAGGRRAVTGEFSLASHHVRAALGEQACLTCHDQSTHRSGYVVLIDPDSGGLIRETSPGAFRNPLTAGYPLSNFCGNCHDGDGARRLAAPMDPFRDGVAPALASRHGNLHAEAGSATEGSFALECTSCHGTHGGGKFAMLPVDGGGTFVLDGAGTRHAVTLEGATGVNSFDDGQNDATAMCVTCHLGQFNPSNHVNGVHAFGDYRRDDCTACHTHSQDQVGGTVDGFITPARCQQCHVP